jgi:hypothetical protein
MYYFDPNNEITQVSIYELLSPKYKVTGVFIDCFHCGKGLNKKHLKIALLGEKVIEDSIYELLCSNKSGIMTISSTYKI